jgi:hypothetical protein
MPGGDWRSRFDHEQTGRGACVKLTVHFKNEHSPVLAGSEKLRRQAMPRPSQTNREQPIGRRVEALRGGTPLPSGKQMRRRSQKKTGLEKASGALKSGSQPAGWSDRWTVPAVCIFLAAITFAVFGQTLRHEFVNYDDDDYVSENPEVARGLTLKGIVWAFTHVHAFNWHPLTWFSHMLDCQFYGLNPGGHHLTNILLHTATAILLFLVLRRMTAALWRSAFVAAVFAIHPLRVESVAWVAERKDVLSGLFFMLTIGACVRYASSARNRKAGGIQTSNIEHRTPNIERKESRSTLHASRFYVLCLLFFALGLMCKPMLVTLPLVLLLLDYWPLERFTIHDSRFTIGRLIIEKIPLLALAGASCMATLFAQKDAIWSLERICLPSRAGNALISCAAYLGEMVWPSKLAVLYPFPTRGIGISEVVFPLVLLAGISTGVFVLRRCRPYLLTGWLWFLGMLTPVIGLIQVGPQARADRYTYLPQIGLYLALTWAVAELCAGWRHRRPVLGGIAAIVIASLSVASFRQTSYWRNSESLWTHALACTSDNAIAHNNLGCALIQKRSVNEAIAHFQKALQINPGYADAQINLSNAVILIRVN